MINPRAAAILDRIVADTKAILGDGLVGIYLHGSLAFGCFNWAKSDIDYLTVVEREPTQAQKEALIAAILALDADCPRKGIEMSVVLARDCRQFTHPTPYVLHYSNDYRDRYRADLAGTCAAVHGLDRDLAAHFTVTRAVGVPLWGAPVADVFALVPAADYLDSIWFDVEGAEDDILENPVYVILNLCRVLAYLRDGAVLSKAQGGEWGIAHLPEDADLIRAALTAYQTDAPFVADIPAPALTAFARARLAEIAAGKAIRPVTDADLDACVALIRASFSTVADEFGITPENAPRFTAFATTRDRLKWQLQEGRPMFCAEAGGRVVGYYSLCAKGDGVCELNNLCVAPDCRHRRIGETLLRHAFAEAAARGWQTMQIGIVEENQRLRRWYERFGFVHTGTQKFDFFPFTCGYMQKILSKEDSPC